jgi:hypothetical protein
MSPIDQDKLRDLFKNYSPQEIMVSLSQLALEQASEFSDLGLADQAKDLVKFSISLDDLISGRPFLI